MLFSIIAREQGYHNCGGAAVISFLNNLALPLNGSVCNGSKFMPLQETKHSRRFPDTV